MYPKRQENHISKCVRLRARSLYIYTDMSIWYIVGAEYLYCFVVKEDVSDVATTTMMMIIKCDGEAKSRNAILFNDQEFHQKIQKFNLISASTLPIYWIIFQKKNPQIELCSCKKPICWIFFMKKKKISQTCKKSKFKTWLTKKAGWNLMQRLKIACHHFWPNVLSRTKSSSSKFQTLLIIQRSLRIEFDNELILFRVLVTFQATSGEL